MTQDYITRDSGLREAFAGGMVRDTNEGKERPDLAFDGPMFMRWVGLVTRGAVKYKARNWMLAVGEEEKARFKESAVRHFFRWYHDVQDGEDHAAGIFFNINGHEYLKDKLASKEEAPRADPPRNTAVPLATFLPGDDTP